MIEEPLEEYEVKYSRTVYTWVRVAARSEQEATELAATRLDESELGALCGACAGHFHDITIEEDENSERDVKVVDDPTEHVILVHDFTLGDPDEDDEDEEEDDEE